MACLDTYATAADYEELLCAGLDLTDAQTVALIESRLKMAAADINAAIASVGACDCTFASWTTFYLQKLNILDAAVIQQCPCGSIDDDQKEMWLEWLEGQFEGIRDGTIALCEGETGSQYPAFAGIEQSLTDANTIQIIQNREARNG